MCVCVCVCDVSADDALLQSSILHYGATWAMLKYCAKTYVTNTTANFVNGDDLSEVLSLSLSFPNELNSLEGGTNANRVACQ